MPPKSHVQTRSKSISKQPAPAVTAAQPPPSAPPSVIAVSGYPAIPAPSSMPKQKTPMSALHFGRTPLIPTPARVSRQGPTSPATSTTSTVSSRNTFAALADNGEMNTVEEQATLDLLGLPDNSFTDSGGGDISSSEPHMSSPNPVKLLARCLALYRPPTPPGTTRGAGSSSHELGCTQNEDGTLRDAATSSSTMTRTTRCRFLPSSPRMPSPPTSPTTGPSLRRMTLTPSHARTPLSSPPSPMWPPRSPRLRTPPAVDIAAAAATEGRAHQARNAAAFAPSAPAPTSSISAPAVIQSSATLPTAIDPAQPAPATAAPVAELDTSHAASQPVPTAAAAPAAPLFTTVVTRSTTQAARRAATGPPVPAAPAPANDTAAGMPAPDLFPALPTRAAVVAGLPDGQPHAAQPAVALQPPVAQQLAAAGTGGAVPGAPAQFAPAAVAAALGGAPLPVFCPFPLDPLDKWDALLGDKVFAYELDGRPHSVDSPATEDLKSAITHLTGNPAPLVGPPEPANSGNRTAPFVYLICGLSQADSQYLLSHRVWNLVGGYTFFVIPYNTPSSLFIFMLDGFTFGAEEGVEVVDVVVSVINGSPTAQTLLVLNHDNYPAGIDPMSHFAASIHNAGGGCTCIAWNVTATPPSCDITNNRAWASTLSTVDYNSGMHWVAKAISPPHFCSACKSPGHVRALCPLQKLPGWNASTSALLLPPPPPSAPNPRGPRPPTNKPRNNGGGQNQGRNNNSRRTN
ncbi:hypothetical protein B0H10DRAFT_2225580 [Mycena sp. CBHHK59/15]|nr:hypothetical protein B0H10DRAFT_2225580 [Mycena sp. CBHHK59/15]